MRKAMIKFKDENIQIPLYIQDIIPEGDTELNIVCAQLPLPYIDAKAGDIVDIGILYGKITTVAPPYYTYFVPSPCGIAKVYIQTIDKSLDELAKKLSIFSQKIYVYDDEIMLINPHPVFSTYIPAFDVDITIKYTLHNTDKNKQASMNTNVNIKVG